jgi:hypothetical protein
MNKFAVNLTSPQTNGISFTGTNTITAQDAYGNTRTDFDASLNNVTVAAVSPLTGTVTGLGSGGNNVLNQSGSFVSGIANLTSSIIYTGNATTGTFTATSATGGYTGTSNSVVIQSGGATKLVITGSGSQTAGTTQNVTITAKDAVGNTATSYTGDKSITFSGANSSTNPVTAPTVTDKNGSAVAFGTATTITFTNGVATVSGSNNGVMTLYRAESATVSVTDGTISSTGADRLSVTVSAAVMNKFAINLTSPQTNGITFTGTNTITAQDAYGNTRTDFSASANNVTISANSPLTGTVSGLTGGDKLTGSEFSSGVANLTSSGLKYTGNAATGTFTATATTGGYTGTSGSVVINAGTATSIAINAGNNQTAIVGTAVSVNPSVIVKDVSNNPVSGVSVTFAVASGGGSITGENASTNASGIATVGSWTLGTTAGANTLTATSTGLTGSPVTFTATGTAGTIYYLTAAGAGSAQTPGSWNTNPAGGGTAATNFTTTGSIFNIPSAINGVVSGNWTFGNAGTPSSLTLTVDGSLTINNGFTLTLAQRGNGTQLPMTVNGSLIFLGTTANANQLVGSTGGGGSAADIVVTLASGATLKTANAGGIVSTTNGSINTTNLTETLNTGANYEFTGASQVMTGIPATVNNLTFSGSGSPTFSAVTNINGTLTVGSGVTIAPATGTITMSSASSGISNSGTLTFQGLTIAATPTSQSQYNSSYSVLGALTINTGVNFAPTSGTITRSGTAWTTVVNGTGVATLYHYTIAGTPATQPTASVSIAGTLQ